MTDREHMPKRRLGQTEIAVSPLGLGTNKFSGGGRLSRLWYPGITQEQINQVVKAALDGGIDWFDTAELYGFGRSEKALASALSANEVADEAVVIGTKWNPMLRTAANLRRTIEHRIRALQGYSIDLYMVHFPVSFSSVETEMNVMADLVDEGKIRAVGVSNFSAAQMRRAHRALERRGLPLAVNQVQYSLLDRKIETNGVLETAKELGVTIVAWAPLGSSILTGRYHQDPAALTQTPFARKLMLRQQMRDSAALVRALDEIGRGYEVSAGQVALNWLIHANGDLVVAIPGASKAYQARDNARALSFKLTDEEMARLDELTSR